MTVGMRRAICAVYDERWQDRIWYKTESRSSITNMFQNVVEKRNPCQSKNRRRRPEPTPTSLLCPAYNISYLSRTVKAVYW